MKTEANVCINWRELIVTDAYSYQQTLRVFVDSFIYYDIPFFVEWDIHAPLENFGFNKLSAPGETPDIEGDTRNRRP